MPVARRYDPALRAQAEMLMDQGLKDSEIADRIGIAGDRGRSAVNWWRRHRRPAGSGDHAGADGVIPVDEAVARGQVPRADFTRLLLLAVRCQKHAEGEAETSCYADRDPERLADLALSIAARMLGLQLPDEEEGSP